MMVIGMRIRVHTAVFHLRVCVCVKVLGRECSLTILAVVQLNMSCAKVQVGYIKEVVLGLGPKMKCVDQGLSWL